MLRERKLGGVRFESGEQKLPAGENTTGARQKTKIHEQRLRSEEVTKGKMDITRSKNQFFHRSSSKCTTDLWRSSSSLSHLIGN
jgi:hypothetical protein